MYHSGIGGGGFMIGTVGSWTKSLVCEFAG